MCYWNKRGEYKAVFCNCYCKGLISFSVGSQNLNFHFPKCVFPQKVFQGNLTTQKTRKSRYILGPMIKKLVAGGKPSLR
jgi:hypothetical protein